MEKEHVGKIYLKNSLGEVIDQEDISFKSFTVNIETEETVFDNQDKDDFYDHLPTVENEACVSLCPDYMKFLCFFLVFCGVQFQVVVIYLVIFFVIIAIVGYFVYKYCTFMKCCSFITCGIIKCNKKKSKESKKNDTNVNVKVEVAEKSKTLKNELKKKIRENVTKQKRTQEQTKKLKAKKKSKKTENL